jgi:tetratricopeptide (TPR) repeat protein
MPPLAAPCLAPGPKGSPQDAEGHYLVGLAYSEMGRWEEAIASYQQAIRCKPDLAEAHASLGVVLSLLGRWQEAALAFSRVVFTCLPEAAPAPAGLLSYYSEALQFLSRSLQVRPESGVLRADLPARPGLSSYQARVETLKAAVEANPQDLGAHYELGEAYMQLGRYPDAVAAYQAAVRLNPEEAQSRYHLAVAYRAMGDLVAAVEEYSILKTLDERLAKQLFA